MAVKAFAEQKTGADGRVYSVRYLLTEGELRGLQEAGLIGEVQEVIGVKEAKDALIAMWERSALIDAGGMVQ